MCEIYNIHWPLQCSKIHNGIHLLRDDRQHKFHILFMSLICCDRWGGRSEGSQVSGSFSISVNPLAKSKLPADKPRFKAALVLQGETFARERACVRGFVCLSQHTRPVA